MVTIDFIARATRAAVCRSSVEPSERVVAYFRAYRRRLRRELAVKGEHGEASQCLIALSSRMIDVTA